MNVISNLTEFVNFLKRNLLKACIRIYRKESFLKASIAHQVREKLNLKPKIFRAQVSLFLSGIRCMVNLWSYAISRFFVKTVSMELLKRYNSQCGFYLWLSVVMKCRNLLFIFIFHPGYSLKSKLHTYSCAIKKDPQCIVTKIHVKMKLLFSMNHYMYSNKIWTIL